MRRKRHDTVVSEGAGQRADRHVALIAGIAGPRQLSYGIGGTEMLRTIPLTVFNSRETSA